jgi:hypothetical protein
MIAKLRSRITPSTTPPSNGGTLDSDERVRLSCGLNETLTQRPLGRAVKRAANILLRATSLGDSLRVRAQR